MSYATTRILNKRQISQNYNSHFSPVIKPNGVISKKANQCS
ncbi:Hypothetical protein ADU71_1130 [Pediococcus damnosus]|nr:Hypothetical protein ADU69_1052 [Pediococcus damnosus]AMV65028.1 Hypothetical protein ADU71_1130 [Pediococcus damnosus]